MIRKNIIMSFAVLTAALSLNASDNGSFTVYEDTDNLPPMDRRRAVVLQPMGFRSLLEMAEANSISGNNNMPGYAIAHGNSSNRRNALPGARNNSHAIDPILRIKNAHAWSQCIQTKKIDNPVHLAYDLSAICQSLHRIHQTLDFEQSEFADLKNESYLYLLVYKKYPNFSQMLPGARSLCLKGLLNEERDPITYAREKPYKDAFKEVRYL